MSQKDLSEKLLEDYDDVFVDIVNVLLFDGEEVIKSDELEPSDIKSQYKADDGRLHEQERDVVKFWKRGGVSIALCGIENQTAVDRYMPLRVIGYDGVAYRSQLLGGRRQERTSTNEECSETEAVSDKNKYPVITLVLYFGEERWNGPKSLVEALNIPERLRPYVSDYRINVYEISYLTDGQLKKFKSDFGILADFFVNKRKDKNYIPRDKKKFKHVDAMLKILKVMAKSRHYEAIFSNIEGSENSMDNIFDRVYEQGIKHGEERIVEKMLEKNYSDEQIMEICGISKEKLEEYKNEILASV